MKALIVPSVTVKFSINSTSSNAMPASAIAIVVSKNILEHCPQLEVPNTVLKPFWHFPHSKPVLLN